MVLIMVAKKVTADKSPGMVSCLGSGLMGIVCGVFAPVWQVSTEIKELKRCHYSWQHPEENNVLERKEELQHVECDSHQQQLPPRNVLFQKIEIPGPERTGMVVRVLFGGNVTVVLVVAGQKARVPVIGKQKGSDGTYGSVQLRPAWCSNTMHGIVRGNKEPCVKVRLQQDKKISKR